MFPHKDDNLSAVEKPTPSVRVGSHVLGSCFPPVFWPDIDVYFQGNLKQAFHLIDRIHEAGGEFLKGAVLHRADVCLKSERRVSYYDKKTGEILSEPYDSVIARHIVPLAKLSKIFSHSRQAGLKLVLSVYDEEGLRFACEAGAVAIKIPSSNITHKSLIENVARCGLPIIIDTGRSRFFEIKRAVSWVCQQDAGDRLIIQHSPPGPPAAACRFHMRMMAYMGKLFNCPVGLSDHHQGIDMLPLAVALGACIIEKGLIVDDAEADIDIAHALPVSQLKKALITINDNWLALGQTVRPDEEVPVDPIDRMCIIAARDIEPGEIIDRILLEYAFPPLGIGVEHLDSILGSTAITLIRKGEPLTKESLAMR